MVWAEGPQGPRKQTPTRNQKASSGNVMETFCLALRGVDFKGVQMVINYDLPQSAVSYIHRIGRTGRAGRKGKAVTFFTENDISNLRSIANVMKLSGCDVPDWMLSIKALNTRQKRLLRLSHPERNEISTISKYDKKKIAKRKDMIEGSKRKSKKMNTMTSGVHKDNIDNYE